MTTDSVELSRLFRRGFAVTFALDLVTKVMAAAMIVVLIRGLSVSHYAYTTLFLTFAQFAGGAATAGVRTRYLREEAERVSRGAAGTRDGSFIAALVKSTLLLVVAGALAVPFVEATGLGFDFGGGVNLIVFSTAFAIGYSLTELAIAHYQADRRFLAAGALSVLRAAALLAASFLIFATHQSVSSISLWFVAAAILIGSTVVAPIARASLAARDARRPLSWFDREETWLSLYYVAAAGFAYVDVMVASALLDPTEVATLGAALRYLAIVLGAIPALGAVLRVRTAQVDLIDSFANQRAMIVGWLQRTTLPAGLVVGVTALLAPFVIPEIDGGKYPDSILVFQIFLATAISAYLTAPSVSILMAQRRHFVLAVVYGLGLLVNLVGDIVVAPTFGVTGIAVVSTVVYVLIDWAMVGTALAHASNPGRRLPEG
jgi:O-antigen/teichoic acid export membrane protein